MATHVRVRLASAGMVASDLLQERGGGRMACIEVGRRETQQGLVVEHFALTEGLTDRDVDELLLRWSAQYGLEATTMGTPFALRLPVPLARITTPGIAELHRVDLADAAPVGHILQGGLCDLWITCRDAAAAEDLARWMRNWLPASFGAGVAVGDPSIADLECWAALRLAEEVSRA